MKNSGIEWIGEIPDSWKIMRLKDVVESHFGGCWGEEASEDDGILCIRIADFDFDRQTIKSSASTKRQYSISQLEKGVLQDGDLILEKSGGGEKTSVGRVVVFEQKMFPCKAMFANFSECLRLKRNLHNEKYCAYLLKALYYTKDMSCFYHQTTGIQNLDIAEYLSMDLCFPSRKEQDVIVDCLNEKLTEVDKLIEVQQAQIEKLKEYKQSVITEAVTKGLDPTAPMKDSGVEWIGKIPEGWMVVQLSSLFYEHKCKNVGMKSTNLLSLSYGTIKRKNIASCEGLLPESFEGYNVISKDDIVLRLTDLQNDQKSLRTGLSTEDGIVTSAYVTLRKRNSNLDVRYMHYFLHTFDVCKGFYGLGSGVRQGLSFDGIKKLTMLFPTLCDQERIANYIDCRIAEIDKLIALKQSKIEKLQEYKKSLIYEYVTGKKEIV